jgi:hypothetical protein
MKMQVKMAWGLYRKVLPCAVGKKNALTTAQGCAIVNASIKNQKGDAVVYSFFSCD